MILVRWFVWILSIQTPDPIPNPDVGTTITVIVPQGIILSKIIIELDRPGFISEIIIEVCVEGIDDYIRQNSNVLG